MTLLPNKHVPIKSSIVGIGAILLRKLQQPSSVSNLWERCKKVEEIATFERFTTALTFLYSIGAITFEDGIVRRGA